MRVANSIALLGDVRFALQSGFMPTLRAILREPSLLLRPASLSRVFMHHVWLPFGDGININSRAVKEQLITPHAQGVVLDIGAGHGHTVDYLDHDKVTRYVALEPNVYMHSKIRERATGEGYTEESGTLVILPYGAQEVGNIISALGEPVDTMVSILTLCSVPSPEDTIKALTEVVLKPGGRFLFYEHVLSPRDDVGWWQRFWTPLWRCALGGCCLDRPTHVWVRKMNGWESGDVWGLDGESEEHLFWHRVGKFIKASA